MKVHNKKFYLKRLTNQNIPEISTSDINDVISAGARERRQNGATTPKLIQARNALFSSLHLLKTPKCNRKNHSPGQRSPQNVGFLTPLLQGLKGSTFTPGWPRQGVGPTFTPGWSKQYLRTPFLLQTPCAADYKLSKNMSFSQPNSPKTPAMSRFCKPKTPLPKKSSGMFNFEVENPFPSRFSGIQKDVTETMSPFRGPDILQFIDDEKTVEMVDKQILNFEDVDLDDANVVDFILDMSTVPVEKQELKNTPKQHKRHREVESHWQNLIPNQQKAKKRKKHTRRKGIHTKQFSAEQERFIRETRRQQAQQQREARKEKLKKPTADVEKKNLSWRIQKNGRRTRAMTEQLIKTGIATSEAEMDALWAYYEPEPDE